MIKKDKSLKRAVNKTMKKNTEKINKIYVYRKKRFLLPLMLAVLIFTVVISTAIGAVSVPFLDTMKIILLDTMKIILKNWEKDWGFLRNIKFQYIYEPIRSLSPSFFIFTILAIILTLIPFLSSHKVNLFH
jgi:heme/copper-type cytochrome/quinol oxidase subunit 4